MTPNSFSDHGHSLDQDNLTAQLNRFLATPGLIVDLGFESTAPMNASITAMEERARFEAFLERSAKFSFEHKIISFDTYRVENFLYMMEQMQRLHPKAEFVFNDVSGILDDQLAQALKDFNFSYIYTASHIPFRSQVHDHMKFLAPEADMVEETLCSFIRAHEFFAQRGHESRLVLDPGFGFSKTFEQNWQLLNGMPRLAERLRAEAINVPLLVGLSKKSFLRKALGSDSFEASEHLHFLCLVKLMQMNWPGLIFRVHNPQIVQWARHYCHVNIT